MNYSRKLLTIIILFETIIFYVNGTRICDEFEFRCDNGECINDYEKCDGKYNCDDHSDETKAVCNETICADLYFRCSYGACVSGDAECNSEIDCVDESDEMSIKCQPDLTGNCTKHIEYQCKSGECLEVTNFCDGKIDCIDGSDETVKMCKEFFCPVYAFKCDYGACISGEEKCDRTVDCIDGSDETPELCNYSTIKSSLITTITTSTTTTTERSVITIQPGSCYLPRYFEHGKIVYASDHTISPEEIMEQWGSIHFICDVNYALLGANESTCLQGNWSNPIPSCKKYCDPTPLHKISLNVQCEYQNQMISCKQLLPPNTIASLFCSIGYEKPERTLPDKIICDNSGEWHSQPWKCEQKCGIPTPDLIPFINGGVFTEIKKVPWHVAIYEKSMTGYSYICGGSIISAKIVISAAHCFWDTMNNQMKNKSLYKIGAGKTFIGLETNERDTIPQILTIEEIKSNEYYLHDQRLYYHDIVVIIVKENIIFKEYIMPVCVDFNLKDSEKYVTSGLMGTLPGWGFTENNYEASAELKVINIPSVNYHDCVNASDRNFLPYITGDKFCAGELNIKSACQGDSGGGLVFTKISNGIQVYYLYGIVSLGPRLINTCDNTRYTLFTNVNLYINLIQPIYIQYLLV